MRWSLNEDMHVQVCLAFPDVFTDKKRTRSDVVVKNTTVLMVDIVNATSFITDQDLITMRELFLQYYEIAENSINRHYGETIRYLGDGVMALFDDSGISLRRQADRSIDAGIEIIKQVREMIVKTETANYYQPSVRVSIATDATLVGERVSTKRLRQELIFGKAPYLASRLKDLADPDTIIISERTHQLSSEKFKKHSLGYTELKGFKNLVQPWKVVI